MMNTNKIAYYTIWSAFILDFIAIFLPMMHYDSPTGFYSIIIVDALSTYGFLLYLLALGLIYKSARRIERNRNIYSLAVLSIILLIIVNIAISSYISSLNGSNIGYLADEVAWPGIGLTLTKISIPLIIIGTLLVKQSDRIDTDILTDDTHILTDAEIPVETTS